MTRRQRQAVARNSGAGCRRIQIHRHERNRRLPNTSAKNCSVGSTLFADKLFARVCFAVALSVAHSESCALKSSSHQKPQPILPQKRMILVRKVATATARLPELPHIPDTVQYACSCARVHPLAAMEESARMRVYIHAVTRGRGRKPHNDHLSSNACRLRRPSITFSGIMRLYVCHLADGAIVMSQPARP